MNSATINTTAHLSEDDLDDFLLGLASSDAAGHAAACPTCRERIAGFESQMSVFNQATRDWSEARSNTISRDLAAHRTPLRITQAGLRYSTAAAVLAVAFTLTTGLHRTSSFQSAAETETVAATTVQDNLQASIQDEIASDNAMLAAIDSETQTPRPASFGLYENTTTPAAHLPRAAIPQVKD